MADKAFEHKEWERRLALKNRKVPDPSLPVYRNGDCGEKSQPGTGYCSPECRVGAERLVRADNS
ncbi:hypothetical protein EGK14_04255 [Erwinia sp. 198]|nr:hypothetical protein EGK14_04255 [Erwinia sp. 198]